MGNLANGLWWMDNGASSWCSTKWGVDEPFFMPYEIGDELTLQLDLHATGIQQEAYVKEVHACLTDGTRILSNLMAKYGPAYWKTDKNYSTLNLFTIRIPWDFGGCETHPLPSTECTCYFLLSPDQFANLQDIVIGFVTYPVSAGFNNIPGFEEPVFENGNWKLVYDCAYENEMIYFYGLDSGGLPVGYAVEAHKDCFDVTCDCYMLFDNYQVLNTDKVVINGQEYNQTDILLYGTIPGFRAAELQPDDQWKVVIDCKYDGSNILFYGGAGIYAKGIYKENCQPSTVDLQCFMFEFEVGFDSGGTVSFYSEPYECNHCEKTLKIGSYYGTDFDTLGVWNFNHARDAVPAISPGALGSIGNSMRIPAILRNLPTKLAVSKNEKCFTFKSEAVKRYELQGTKAYPPYFATFVESVLLGKRFRINGTEYQVRGDTAFETISINGVSAYRLKVQLEACTSVTYFDCN
jgi:hypothetical protein